MERRDFILKSGMLAAFAAISPGALIAGNNVSPADPVKPMLLPSLPPLDNRGGMDIRVWMRSSMTNGAFSSVECAVAPKLMGPPPHYHKELDEIMFVLDGTASVLIGDEVVEVKAGGWHLRPRMIKHTFWNASSEPLRFYDLYFNQPFEEYLERIFHELTTENGFPDGSEARNQEIGKLNDKFGLIFPPSSMSERDEIMKTYGLK
jgi:mannose-6-phosphate isomerase-like protein (cupin superfamily)